MVTTLSVPSAAKMTSASAMDALKKALASDLSPLPPNPGDKHERLGVRLPIRIQADIDARRGNLSVAAFASGLIRATLEPQRAISIQKRAPDAGHPLFEDRPEQARFYELATRHMGSRGIVLAEGSTGIGKGRVIAAIAAQYAKDGVVVTAPTIQVLSQLLSEYEHLPLTDKPVARFLFGRPQFVSESGLIDWFAGAEDEEQEMVAAARRWLNSGAGHVPAEDGQGTAMFHRHMPGISHLAEDLLQICPDAPMNSLRLTDEVSDTDAGEVAYQKLRARAMEAGGEGPVFATHAALVYDALLRHRGHQGILPQRGTLLIDEAHQLAKVAEDVYGKSVAFTTMINALGDVQTWKPLRMVAKARRALPVIKSVREELKAVENWPTTARERSEQLRPFARRIKDALAPFCDLNRSGSVAPILTALEITEAILSDKGTNVDVHFSPKYRHVSFMMGPASLKKSFTDIWDNTVRAGLFSATLYLPRRYAMPTCGLISASLHLPKDRLQTMEPIMPTWVTSDVTVMTSKDDADRFTPPNESRHEDFNTKQREWHQAVANRIAFATKTAGGGTLVLLTSYETLSALADLLAETLGDRLVVQQRDAFRQALDQYRRLHGNGKRPVWLATGPAWTGLDLSDKKVPPEEDTLLTDVIIPRVPFGTEHSRTHRIRMSWMHTADRDRAAFQCKQGMGRLVRRRGLRGRRLWMIDGRIWSTDQSYVWLMEPVRMMLEVYKNVF